MPPDLQIHTRRAVLMFQKVRSAFGYPSPVEHSEITLTGVTFAAMIWFAEFFRW